MILGDFEILMLSDGQFRLDGGAMFGVVPKVLWQRTDPPDEMNRILMGLNCLLIKSGEERILVDTGIGSLHDEKFASMFQIDQSAGGLLDNLAAAGHKPAEITRVILTHLHFDHSGGNCTRGDDGELRPTFAHATYYFQNGEFDYARQPDPRSKASYLSKNWDAVERAGQLRILDGDSEILPGLSVEITGGHTEFHQIVKIQSGGKTACFLADLVPTSSHLKTPYVMGYDLFPKQTMEKKASVLKKALAEEWLLLFEHDARVAAGYLREQDGKMKLESVAL